MSDVRYARLVFHAVRLAGRNPVVATHRAARALTRDAGRRLCCRVLGCDWSWVRAAEIGVMDRPVCGRCMRPLPDLKGRR